jgi:acetyl/propionyl-CoA carboxylase alpha subunit/acetyl-CoA carboxylase carboxyltransferase component
MISKLLIANRGEVSIRIAQAAAELGIISVAVFCAEDAACLHVARADEALALPHSGAAAYLDGAAIVAAAVAAGCDALHPGYGFLSENAGFARACADAGLIFVGPSPETLELFGDKAAARRLALEVGLPLARGTSRATSFEEADAEMAALGGPVMVKALSGGGGRGMRVVERREDLPDAFRRAGSEALAAFGSDALYVEELIRPARHIEVQVIGDATGAILHLGERECSLQRRHQKLIEIAPAPHLAAPMRQALCDAALTLARAGRVTSLTTIEFLVDDKAGRFVFMEANPRLQVEHPVTEEVMGIDLVKTQIRLACGENLAELGLSQEAVVARGMAVQARINMERVVADGSALPTGGALSAFDPPGGAGIRVESFGYSGYRTTASFDSLLAKLIVFAPSGRWEDARAKLERALGGFRIAGVETNRGFLMSLLADAEVAAGAFDTTLVGRKAGVLVAAQPGISRFAAQATPNRAAADADEPLAMADGLERVVSPMGGLLVAIDVAVGDAVEAGARLAVIEAMKMEHLLTAPISGTVRSVHGVAGAAVAMGETMIVIELGTVTGTPANAMAPEDVEAAAHLGELRAKRAGLLDEGRSDAVARQRKRGALTARERIARLCDERTFTEFGGLIRGEKLTREAPADGVVTGSARVDGRPVMVIAQDFTVFGGSSGHLGGAKMERAATLAKTQGIPLVMLLDGGGHRIQDGQSSRAYAAAVTIFHEFARMTGWVPMVSAVLGAGFAANTNYSAMADFVVMVKGRSTMGLAGPALVRAGTGEEATAEALGGTAVQVDAQGLADFGADSEEAALDAIRRFLSYLPSNAGLPSPMLSSPPGAPESLSLERLVPANTRRSYDMGAVVAGLVDPGSVFELKPSFARNIITAFARLGGRSVGVIANQPLVKGGMLDADACEKAGHFIALCDAFGLPLIYLVDIPGLSIGSGAERSTLGRRSAKMLFELGHATVPRISVILRKGYGLGYLAMAGGRSFDADACFAWPTAEICAMSVEGSVDVAYRKDYETAPDPKARRQELIDAIRAGIGSVKAAEGFGIDDVIEPDETRARLIEVLERAPARRRRDLPPKIRAIAPI